jgi:hypothetical protein
MESVVGWVKVGLVSFVEESVVIETSALTEWCTRERHVLLHQDSEESTRTEHSLTRGNSVLNLFARF